MSDICNFHHFNRCILAVFFLLAAQFGDHHRPVDGILSTICSGDRPTTKPYRGEHDQAEPGASTSVDCRSCRCQLRRRTDRRQDGQQSEYSAVNSCHAWLPTRPSNFTKSDPV